MLVESHSMAAMLNASKSERLGMGCGVGWGVFVSVSDCGRGFGWFTS